MLTATRNGLLAATSGGLLLRSAALFATVLLVAACGGAAPGGTAGGAGSTTVASIEVATSKSSIAARADETVTITVTALDSLRRGVSGAPVQIAADSGVLSVPSAATDASGNVTATFSLGQDRSNRIVTIQGSSGGLAGIATIQVTGTTLALSSNTSVVSGPNATAKITALLKDAASQPISGAVVVFSTTQGTLSASTTTTDAGGIATTDITGISSSATITSRAGNSSSSVSIVASGTSTVTLEPAGILIDDFIVQANPSVTGPNQPGNSGNFSSLEVRVFGTLSGTSNLPVKNAPVRFRIASSPALGVLEVNTSTNPALSNDVGVAGNRFIPGAATSGADFIVVCASVSGLSTPATPGLSFAGNPCGSSEKAIRLTIAQQALFVKISTDATLEVTDNGLTRTKSFTVNVTDAAGRGVPGVLITPRLLPISYFKGSYFFDDQQQAGGPPPSNQWTPVGLTECANEDKNFDGILQSGEDVNADGALWPGQVAAVSLVNNGLTDGTGFVVLKLKWGVRFSTWAKYQVEARASVGGTEGLATTDYRLDALVSEVQTKTPAPAWIQEQPFGFQLNCATPN